MERSIPRTDAHDALAVFLGKWSARGTSYGGKNLRGADPRSNGEAWVSVHEGAWHTGRYFLIQDEKADIAGRRFDALSILGVGPQGRHFMRLFDNNGFDRHYQMFVRGSAWSIEGATERARIEFADQGRTQNISWEWRPEKRWLPLCERVAVRVD